MKRSTKFTLAIASAGLSGEAAIIAASAVNKNKFVAVVAATTAVAGLAVAGKLCSSAEQEFVDKYNNLVNEYNDLFHNSKELMKIYSESYGFIKEIKESLEKTVNEEGVD